MCSQGGHCHCESVYLHRQELDIPKLSHMLLHIEGIRDYGMIAIGNTGPREQQNKQIKQAAWRTRLGSSGDTAKVHNCSVYCFLGVHALK